MDSLKNTKNHFNDLILLLLSQEEQDQLKALLKEIPQGKKDSFFLSYSRMNIFSKSPSYKHSIFHQTILPIDLKHWNTVEFLRIYCILNLPVEQDYHLILDQLLQTSDYKERIAYYKGLVLYPQIQKHYQRAREGLRSSIQPVFESIAFYNPYPANHLDEEAWNQMILKALFLGSNINLISSLDQKVNPALKDMLIQYAQERVVANRRVDPRLWRCVGPFLETQDLPFLEQALNRKDNAEQLGAALALSLNSSDLSQNLLNSYPNLKQKIHRLSLSWDSIQ